METSYNPHENVRILTKEQVMKSPLGYCSNDKSFNYVNMFIFILFFISMGTSLYTFTYQMQYEERIRKIQLLDDRISIMEEKLRLNQFPNSYSSPPNHTYDSEILYKEKLSDKTASISEIHGEIFSDMLEEIALELSNKHRLRRDVTQLKAFRRGKRQTAIQQTSECICPPGKFSI